MTTSELWLEPMIFSLPIPNVTYLQNLRLLSAVSHIQGFLPLSHLTISDIDTVSVHVLCESWGGASYPPDMYRGKI